MNVKGVHSKVETEPLLPTYGYPCSPQDARSKSRPARRVLAVFTLLGLAVALASFVIIAITAGVRIGGRGGSSSIPINLPPPRDGVRNPAILVRGHQGAVATEAEICSNIGVDVLRDNGTAVDAAIAAALCGNIFL
jgi:gamma-glutamyltranspeptidase / glutathione hydrolase / leukotriene-C4 hydrolase